MVRKLLTALNILKTSYMKALNVTQKLISSHLLQGEMIPGLEIGLKIDQTLTQDATGTMVMLELEAMGLNRVKTEVSVQYVDHNLLQADYRNAEDHIFLKSAAQHFGIWFSRPGNGVSHPVHMERFGIPGKTLVGSDSHTPAAGSLGMLALGAGGLDVAFVMVGQPLYFKMPKVLGVKLTGALPDWVSAKDVILEMLRRYDVKGCRGMIVEYYGPGLDCLSAMDRHVIANMGTELGATTTVFPSDKEIYRFLKSQQREKDWTEIIADPEAAYDLTDEINLSNLEPLIACPSSPGNVVKVREVEGQSIAQVIVGSSANPGIRDFWVVGEILKDRTAHPDVSLDVNPTSRQVIQNLISTDSFASIIKSGGRFHQAGCMGCIGMGQAPASNKISLRTVPRNFPGRSGTLDDQVYLCSPETAATSAITGRITDPRDLEKMFNMKYPRYQRPEQEIINTDMLLAPPADGSQIQLEKGENIKAFPTFQTLPNEQRVPVILKMGDNISTDEILKAGVKVLALRSNIPEISKWAFAVVDPQFYDKAVEAQENYGGHLVVAGENYAQGSSREHAAIAPRYLCQIAVVAKSYARLGWQNLVNFGIVPFEFANPIDYDNIETNDIIKLENLAENFRNGNTHIAYNETRGRCYELKHSLSERQIHVILAGGVINYLRMSTKETLASVARSDV
jgi:aconitate hydratase